MPSYKANKTSFKKGQSGNPAGGPKLPEDLRLLMRSTGEQMKRDICEVYSMRLTDLQVAERDPEITAGRAAVISCLNNSIQVGDDKALQAMFNRILGKVPEAEPIVSDSKGSVDRNETVDKLVAMLNDTRPNAKPS